MVFECLQAIHFTPIQFLQCFCAQLCDLIHIRILFCFFVFQCTFISFQILSVFIGLFDGVVKCVRTWCLCAQQFDSFIYHCHFIQDGLTVVHSITILFFQFQLYFTKFIIV